MKRIEPVDTALSDAFSMLALTARCVLDDGLAYGIHRTGMRGGTAEFVDYRMYSQGDDASQIDWKVFGKTDRLYLRSLARMSDLTVQLIVDASPSMHFAGPVPTRLGKSHEAPMTKFRFASTLAASLALLALRQRDRSMLNIIGTAADAIGENLEPGSTFAHYTRILHSFAAHSITETEDLSQFTIGQALARCCRMLTRPARRLVFVFSDLLDDIDDLASGLSHFAAARCDVVACQVLTPVELSLTGLPRGTYRDPEQASSVNADPDLIRTDYVRRLNTHISSVRKRLQGMNIEHRLLITTPTTDISMRSHLNGAFKAILSRSVQNRIPNATS